MPCSDSVLNQAGRLRAEGHKWADVADLLGVNKNSLKRDFNQRRRAGAEPPAPAVHSDGGVRVIEARQRWTVEQIAQAHGLDLAEWRCTKFQPGRWQQGQKDGDGNPVVVCLESTRATFERLPPWLTRGPIQPGVVIPPPEGRLELAAELETVLLVPDMQVGLRRPQCDPTRPRPGLEPSHHRAGIALMLQVVHAVQPDRIVFVGDDLDAEEWSTYGHGLEADGLTDAALHELHFIYEQTRLAAPSARIDCLQGNHGYRIERELKARMKAATQLRRVGERDPVVSIPSLLGLDALHIDYHGPYGSPAGDLWLWRTDPRLRTLVTHGRQAAKAGQLVGKLLPSLMHSHWQGHDTTAQLGHRTLHDLAPSRSIACGVTGALARRDGATPSTRRGNEDWTAAFGRIRRVGGRAFHSLLPVELDDAGRDAACWVGDRLLRAHADDYEQRLHARWPGFGYLGG